MNAKHESFLTDEIMSGGDWRAFELAVLRLVGHCGWENVQDVGRSGDKGADVLAIRKTAAKKSELWLFQCKTVTSGNYVGLQAIEQALNGQSQYESKHAVIVTNGEFTKSAYKRRDELNENGFNVRLWNGAFITGLLKQWSYYSEAKREPRIYQKGIIDTCLSRWEEGASKCLFVVATGLGKTVIASSIAAKFIEQGIDRILVLCHANQLAQQLQKEFWTQIPKDIPTRLFLEGAFPSSKRGISFGLYQTLSGNLPGIDPSAWDIVIVDEAHHAPASVFADCLEALNPRLLIGMTATPWRGDGISLDNLFGEPISKVSLVDGMRMGYLARVDYRLMCDNIEWSVIPELAKVNVTIADLNRRLFIPQRDAAVIQAIREASKEVKNPRIAIFSPSRAHASEFAELLVSAGIPAASVSTGNIFETRKTLAQFSAGSLQAVTAVDVLNEGIDVPDVNIIVFLRATHSRRIFVQQLGRGLRLAPGKNKVIVLDFVTDIRRIAAAVTFDRDARESRGDPAPGEIERVYLREGVVTFADEKVEAFIKTWLTDVADLEDSSEKEKLKFPSNFE